MQIVREIMTRGVETVNESMPLVRVAQKMRDCNIGFLAIGNGHNLIGCVTDRDIVINAVARGLNPMNHRVSEVMTHHLVTCDQNMKVSDVAKLMQDQKIYRVVVTDERKNPVGVVSFGDLSHRSDESTNVEAVLREVSGR